MAVTRRTLGLVGRREISIGVEVKCGGVTACRDDRPEEVESSRSSDLRPFSLDVLTGATIG